MQTQIMNKSGQGLGDSSSTYQQGLSSGLNSFQFPNICESWRLQRSDKSTITDQIICNCACETIPKLKQKAHKSFMQVIQIENLYKDEIKQLKGYYEESIRSNNKKFQIKEDLLNERCKQLESEIEKIKDIYKKEKPYDVQEHIENPFDLDSIDNIMPNSMPDDSSQSIYNIRQFIQTPNLRDSSKRLEEDINSYITEAKQVRRRAEQDEQCTENQNPQEQAIMKIQNQIKKIFEFVNNLIENTVQAYQKYNELVQLFSQAQNRYSKLYGLHEAGLKQSKFMTEHVKKISQDRARMERKINQLERTIKSQEDSIKFLKKMISQKQVLSPVETQKKDFDCLSSSNMRDDDYQYPNVNSLLSTKFERKNHCLMTKSVQNAGDKILPRGLNFKKKQVNQKSEPKN